MLRMLRNVGLGVASILLAGILTTSAYAAPSGGIGGRPSSPDPTNPRSQSIFIHTLDGGAEASDAVLVTNSSDKVRKIDLYAVDGVVSSGGAYSCRQKSEALTDSGKWIKLEKNTLVLAPDSKEEVKFTITVPKNADVGEHNACIVIADKDQETVNEGAGIRIRTRQAIRVVTTIPGDLHREITLTNFLAQIGDKGLPTYNVELQNKGNVSADVNVEVRLLSSITGKEYYKNGGVYPILANEKLVLNFEDENPPFWGGWFRAVVTVQYNDNPAMLGFNPSAGIAGEMTREETIFIMPSTSALFIIGLASVIVVGLVTTIVVRKLRARKRKRNWQDYIVEDGDTLDSLASKSGVKWKLIAKTNNLSAPYTLAKGQLIKIPSKSTKKSPIPVSPERAQPNEVTSAHSGPTTVEAPKPSTNIEVKRPGWSSSDSNQE